LNGKRCASRNGRRIAIKRLHRAARRKTEETILPWAALPGMLTWWPDKGRSDFGRLGDSGRNDRPSSNQRVIPNSIRISL
jgi:hypothetical protein